MFSTANWEFSATKNKPQIKRNRELRGLTLYSKLQDQNCDFLARIKQELSSNQKTDEFGFSNQYYPVEEFLQPQIGNDGKIDLDDVVVIQLPNKTLG